MIVCVFLRPNLSWLPSDELDDAAAAAEDNMRTIYKVSLHCTEDTYSLLRKMLEQYNSNQLIHFGHRFKALGV